MQNPRKSFLRNSLLFLALTICLSTIVFAFSQSNVYATYCLAGCTEQKDESGNFTCGANNPNLTCNQDQRAVCNLQECPNAIHPNCVCETCPAEARGNDPGCVHYGPGAIDLEDNFWCGCAFTCPTPSCIDENCQYGFGCDNPCGQCTNCALLDPVGTLCPAGDPATNTGGCTPCPSAPPTATPTPATITPTPTLTLTPTPTSTPSPTPTPTSTPCCFPCDGDYGKLCVGNTLWTCDDRAGNCLKSPTPCPNGCIQDQPAPVCEARCACPNPCSQGGSWCQGNILKTRDSFTCSITDTPCAPGNCVSAGCNSSFCDDALPSSSP